MNTNTTPITTSTAIDTTRIVDGILDRISINVKANYDILLDMDQQTEVYNFLCQHVATRTRVCFLKNIPNGDYVTKLFAINEKQVMTLAYGKNRKEDDTYYPNILFVSITKKERSRLEKFKDFWEYRKLPVAIFEEAASKISLEAPVEIVAFERAYAWNAQRKAEPEDLVFIGQTPHVENGSFVPNKPIGYVIGQKIVITIPNAKLEGGRAYYTFK